MNLTLKSLLCALLLTVTARADDVYVRSGKEAAELPFKNVLIKDVKNGDLIFMINTREAHRPISEISRIELSGETQFNAAEKAFSEARVARDDAAAKPKFSEAVSGYQATIGSTNKPWLKEYAAIRMQTAAPKSGRFDAALTAWKAMVEKDPAAALHTKPSVEGIDPKSQYLIAATRDLTTLVNSTPKPDAKRAYLDLLNDVQTAMGDTEGAIKTAEMRVALGGTPEEVAELALKQAQADLANKKYDAALERLGKVNLTSLNDSARAEASFLTAECKAARLQPNAPADEWKDAAIDYMRVVAAFPSSANAAAALLKVAQIHETLKEPDVALRIYQQVAREHANTPAAQAAQKAIERLGGRQAAAGK